MEPAKSSHFAPIYTHIHKSQNSGSSPMKFREIWNREIWREHCISVAVPASTINEGDNYRAPALAEICWLSDNYSTLN